LTFTFHLFAGPALHAVPIFYTLTCCVISPT